MHTNNRVGTVLCILICLFATSAAADNLVPNGSFAGGTYIGPNGETIPNGWINLPTDNVALSDVNVESSNGSYYVAFSSPETDGSQDCLYTTFSTVVGQEYTVSFEVALTAASVGNTDLTPQWSWLQTGQTNMLNSFYYDPTNTGPEGFEEFTFTEIAENTSTNLMFHGTDANGAILLENVVVTPVTTPEPSTAILLLAGIVLMILTRKRIARGYAGWTQ